MLRFGGCERLDLVMMVFIVRLGRTSREVISSLVIDFNLSF